MLSIADSVGRRNAEQDRVPNVSVNAAAAVAQSGGPRLHALEAIQGNMCTHNRESDTQTQTFQSGAESSTPPIRGLSQGNGSATPTRVLGLANR